MAAERRERCWIVRRENLEQIVKIRLRTTHIAGWKTPHPALMYGSQHQTHDENGENSASTRHGEGRDVSKESDLGLEQFRAQPK